MRKAKLLEWFEEVMVGSETSEINNFKFSSKAKKAKRKNMS